jgi:hypothetical protein
MEIPPDVAAKISQKQQYAWECGLIQGLNWYVNKVIQPSRKESHKNAEFFIDGEEYLVLFDGHISSSGEYDGTARLFGEAKQLLFELSFQGYTEDFYPQWKTRGPSAQSAVKAFVEGPWIEQFLSYLSGLKVKQNIEAEERGKIIEQESVEDLKNLKSRFGLS